MTNTQHPQGIRYYRGHYYNVNIITTPVRTAYRSGTLIGRHTEISETRVSPVTAGQFYRSVPVRWTHGYRFQPAR